MQAESGNLLRLCNPIEYCETYLRRGLLPDGRSVNESRTLALQLGVISKAHGSAMVRQGGTAVIVSISGEISTPLHGNGSTSLSFELSIDVDQHSLLKNELCDTMTCLQQLLDDDVIISRHELIISKGKVAWNLSIHFLLLSADGPFIDVSVVGLVAALADTSLPQVTLTLNEEGGPSEDDQVFKLLKANIDISEEKTKVFCLLNYPVASTFAFWKATNGRRKEKQTEQVVVISDPSHEMAAHCAGACTVIVGSQGTVFRIRRLTGVGLSPAIFDQLIHFSAKRHKSVHAAIARALHAVSHQSSI